MPKPANAPERVTVGVRPEHVRLTAEGAPRSAPFEVALSEPLGAETHLVLAAGDVELRARAPGFDPRPRGSAVHVALDETKLHLFDGATGARLS